MSQMNMVGTYNTRPVIDAKKVSLEGQIKDARKYRVRMAFEAKQQARDKAKQEFFARRDEICDLVRLAFYAVPRQEETIYQVPRTFKTLAKAYATAENLARIGGEDYAEACRSLKFARGMSHANYQEACLVAQIGLKD